MISVVVLTKNEEKNIVDCLESLAWCDEVIIIDDQSEDRTAEISQKLGAKVFKHNFDGDFSKQRNFGLAKAKGEWVLFVDADERISSTLQKEIENIILSQNKQLQNWCGFYINRVDFMWGRKLKYGETGNIKLLRLAAKSAGSWVGKVHETWQVKGKIGELINPLLHYPHQTLTEFLQDINFYTDLRSLELYQKKIKAHWWSIIVYPKAKFAANFFIKRGFLDGIPGLVNAIMMSFHSFLVRGKLWLLWQRS